MAKEKACKLSHAKKLRGVVRASITHMEDTIAKLELKAELSTCEQLLVPQLIKKIEDWDAEFKLHHQTILDLVDEEQHETLEQEYPNYNEYDDRVTMLLFVFSNCKTYQRVHCHLRRILLRVSVSRGY